MTYLIDHIGPREQYFHPAIGPGVTTDVPLSAFRQDAGARSNTTSEVSQSRSRLRPNGCSLATYWCRSGRLSPLRAVQMADCTRKLAPVVRPTRSPF